MKFTLIILTVLAPFFAHAGGGGGLRPGMQTMMMKSPEVIYHLGDSTNTVQFAYGKFENNNWKIEKLSIDSDALNLNRELSEAILKSNLTNSWVPLGPQN